MSPTYIQLPVIDLSQPIQSPSLSSLSKACQEWGFFYATNHGIPESLLSEVHALSKQTFNQSLDSKLKIGPLSAVKTYTPQFIASPYFESLRVSGPDFSASAKASAAELFNDESIKFSEILQEYGSKMMEISKRVIQIVLRALGSDIEEKFLESEFSNCHGYLRIINYSPPNDVELKEVEGLGMHTDMSCITIVYQDETGGLQMRSKEGEWMEIPPSANTLVVNIGDLLQAWSNGRLRSSEHRVVLRKFVHRFSLACFWCFDDEKVIFAPEEVVGEGNPRIYKPFKCLDYLKFRENHDIGKFDKIGFTVRDFAGLTTS